MQKYGELLRAPLEKRGIADETQAEIFLNPDYERDLFNPFMMRDMEQACVRLFEAIENKEKIIVYADYDCDGMPGAVILTDLFKLLGISVTKFTPTLKDFSVGVYIPERNSEGYGLNLDAIRQFKESGVKLIITIDLGITAIEEVAQAEVDGLNVIITDHHLPRRSLGEGGFASLDLPRAYAILNPKVDDYPEKMLCGAGVAFKFAQGFIKKYGEYFKIKKGAEKWMLDMAGLATLSDMVPLLGGNRGILYFLVEGLEKHPRSGIQKSLVKK